MTISKNSAAVITNAPVIILVNPQMGENIGMVARAMLNCAIGELRIVNPRDGWPNPKAISASSGAVKIIESAKIYDDLVSASSDLQYLLAATARVRDLEIPAIDTVTSANILQEQRLLGNKTGIIFGNERNGLSSNDIVLANKIINIPLNPGFNSLNLAAAVLLVSHNWYILNNNYTAKKDNNNNNKDIIANTKQVDDFVKWLDKKLIDNAYYNMKANTKPLQQNIYSLFKKNSFTENEVNILYGIISSFDKIKK